MTADFESFLRRYEAANSAFVNGDVSLWMPLVSRFAPTSIYGGFGGYEIGWDQVGPRYEWASAQFRPNGAEVDFEYLVRQVGDDLAYTAAIERCTAWHVTQPEPVPHVLRVTMIFRREDDGWKIAHRHADPLSPAAPPPGL